MKRALGGIFCLLAAASLAVAADNEEAKALPEAPGRDAFAKVCLSCHGAGNVRKKRLTKEGWADVVADMVDRGAEATEPQQATVVEYLTQAFGKGSKIYINTAPFEELRSILGLTVDESKAVLTYRKEKGDFKSWEDLQKMDGVDAKKFETKKDLIAF